MRINTNVASLNANRILQGNSAQATKIMGRLSSGFRINRAADDAAGLGIANKLRADIRSMRQASRNAEQATSLLQIAEGATSTVNDILGRMKELATQAASDNVSDDDRTKLNSEFTALRSEITRIVDTTKYGGKLLLNGSMGNEIDAASEMKSGAAQQVTDGIESITLSGAATGDYVLSRVDDTTLRMTSGGVSQDLTVTNDARNTLNFSEFGITIQTNSDFDLAAAQNTDAALTAGRDTITVSGGNADFLVSASGEGSYATDKIQLSSLDLSSLAIAGDDLTTAANATTALTAIDTSIETVSGVLGDIGAAQNRIDYATANVKTAVENFSAAESTIRDADMAAEMSEFTRFQILQQAGTAMLAQANSAPQQILRLIQ